MGLGRYIAIVYVAKGKEEEEVWQRLLFQIKKAVPIGSNK